MYYNTRYFENDFKIFEYKTLPVQCSVCLSGPFENSGIFPINAKIINILKTIQVDRNTIQMMFPGTLIWFRLINLEESLTPPTSTSIPDFENFERNIQDFESPPPQKYKRLTMSLDHVFSTQFANQAYQRRTRAIQSKILNSFGLKYCKNSIACRAIPFYLKVRK